MDNTKNSNSNNNKGFSVCPVCGALVPDNSFQCLVCGHKLEDAEPLTVSNGSYSPISPSRLHKNRRTTRLVAFFLVFVLLAGGFTAGAFEYLSFQHLKSQYNTKNAVLYHQQHDGLKIKFSSFEDASVISQNYNNSTEEIVAKSSYDERFVAYLDNQTQTPHGYQGHLKLLDLTTISDKNTRVAKPIPLYTKMPVVDFSFSSKEDILTFLTADGELYQCDYNRLSKFFNSSYSISNTLLDKDVKGIVDTSATNVLYYKGNDAHTSSLDKEKHPNDTSSVDLYTIVLDEKKAGPILIDKNIYEILDSSRGFSKILYTKLTDTNPHKQFSVNYYDDQQEEPISVFASNISYLVDYNIETQEIVYLSESQRILNFNSLFEDSMLEQDEIAASTFETEEDSEETELETEITEQEEEQEQDSPQTDEQSKETRDNLRSKLRLSLRTFKDENPIAYNLHYENFSKDERTIISEGLYSIDEIENLVECNLEKGYIFFVEGNIESIAAEDISNWELEKIEKILEIGKFDIREYLAEHIPESLVLYSTKNKSFNTVYSESGEKVITDYKFVPDVNEIFFISKPSYSSPSGTLYSGFVIDGMVDKIPYIDDYVIQAIGVTGLQQNNVVYQTASNDVPPEYTIYKQTLDGIVEMAVKTSPPETINIADAETGVILYFRDYKNFPARGELYMYTQEESHLSDNVYQYLYRDVDDILFFEIALNNSFSIKHFNDGEQYLVDDNVISFCSFNNEIKPQS